MEWISLIITAIVSLAGGGGVGYYLTLKERKKEAGLSNKQLEENINSTVTDNMIKMFDQLQEQNKDFIDQLNKKDHIIAEKDKIIEEKNNIIEEKNKQISRMALDIQASSSFLCKNDLCPLREPAKGLGPLIFKQMKDKGEIKGNQTSISEVARKKGYTIEKLVCKT